MRAVRRHTDTLFHGLRDGELVHISQVENGLTCNCVCSSCGEKLIARTRSKKAERLKSFAHQSRVDCAYGFQTAIHLRAKDIIKEAGRIKLPKYDLVIGRHDLFSGQYISCELFTDEYDLEEIDDVVLEKKIDDYIPDVVIVCKSGKRLLVEVAVTHFVDQIKLSKIRRSGISAIEIDLKEHKTDFNDDFLRHWLIDDTSKKAWLYNRRGEEAARKRIKDIEERNSQYWREEKKKEWEKEKRLEQFYLPIVQRKINNGRDVLHIQNCPLKKRRYEDIQFANYVLDCKRCPRNHGLKRSARFLACVSEDTAHTPNLNQLQGDAHD